MLRKLRPRSIYDVFAVLALVVALGGTSAWAMHEVINSSDVVNESLLSEDIKNGEIGSADVKDNSINTFDANALHGSDIIDNSLTGTDLGPGSVGSSEVANNSLNDEDVGEGTSVDFELNIGTVTSGDCVERTIGAAGATGDHLLLTPDVATAHGHLSYGIEYHPSQGNAFIKVCNPNDSIDVNDTTTRFNLIVFDAH